MSENKSIGALWCKQSEKGDYYTGTIEKDGQKYKIVVFKNNYKTEERHPDFKIFESKKQEKQETTGDDLPF